MYYIIWILLVVTLQIISLVILVILVPSIQWLKIFSKKLRFTKLYSLYPFKIHQALLLSTRANIPLDLPSSNSSSLSISLWTSSKSIVNH